MTNWYSRLAFVAVALAFVVVVLGAYTRISDAGLGCPDWPTCYGHLTVPDSQHTLTQLDQRYPDRPVEPAKAWKEMIHRYFAGTLGLVILALAVMAWVRRRRERTQPAGLPTLLLLLVVFQAALGMWTVTLLLKPTIVMGHLLGGMAILSLLWLLALRSGGLLKLGGAWQAKWPRWLALAGLVVLIGQIALGGWTSSNYAAYACPDFPTCQGQWWPNMDFGDAFVLWHQTGIDFEGGILANSARAAIHVSHRLGALATFIVLGSASVVFMIAAPRRSLKVLGAVVALFLVAQIGLGIGLVELGFPVSVAVAHNGNAALLLLSVVTLNAAVWRGRATEGALERELQPAEPVQQGSLS
ncbi:MAG TPA: COX15/CtaA family protein [Gammaproteobacteria bacterium]|jgi:cytochrome c oxidase assembly protein subunit 15|nr:COX15/CtaA family protein [Gammaproteobacteria bacterium]HET7587669.1 COX15/CtaA family protein [Gammaproteobacteria bacterium]